MIITLRVFIFVVRCPTVYYSFISPSPSSATAKAVRVHQFHVSTVMLILSSNRSKYRLEAIAVTTVF